MVKVEVSLGELLDKYSILEIKAEKIHDEKKLERVFEEMGELAETVLPLIGAGAGGGVVAMEYRLLKYVNRVIWDLNDVYCALESFDGKRIMEENNARFRVKRWINERARSRLQEVKSYAGTRVWINAKGECGAHPLNVLLFAQWKMLYYDEVYVVLDGDIDDEILEVYRVQVEERGEDDRIFVVRDSEELHESTVDVDIALLPSEFTDILLAPHES